AATQTHQVPQGLQGPHPWQCQGWDRAEFRRLWPQGHGAGADHRAPDRGGPPCDHASHPPPGPSLDPHLPGRAGIVQAGRSPHGLGQGQPGILGRARQAGPHPVRAGRRSGPDRPRRLRARDGKASDQDQGGCPPRRERGRGGI
ncbi:MAG: LSU ribosomal protein L16p (L10e), partial [uncultured Sphingosinicella sp.]